MKESRELLKGPDNDGRYPYNLPDSSKHLPDEVRSCIKLPGIEGPATLAATLEKADKSGLC